MGLKGGGGWGGWEERGVGRKEKTNHWSLRNFLKENLLKLFAALEVGENYVWGNKSMLVKLQSVR